MKNFLTVIILAIFISGCQTLSSIETVKVREQEITVEVAKETKELSKGLMFRDSLEKDHGMLFIFDDEQTRHFWMKNVNFPLLAVFISADKKVVDIQEMAICAENEKCPVYDSTAPAQYVLEVNVGDFAGDLGDMLEF